MKNSIVAFARTSAASIITCAVAAFAGQPADAQTAKKLKCNGCVSSKHIKNGAIKGADIRNNTISGALLRNNAITSGKIADGQVGTPDLANNAVTSDKIADGQVGTDDLGNGTVSGAKIQDNAITGGKIVDGQVGTPDLADNAVTTDKIADGQVGTVDLAAGAVTSVKIEAGAVGAAAIASESVPASDLSNEAGAGFNGGLLFLQLDSGPTVVRFVTITPPSPGAVIVNASGFFEFFAVGRDTGTCSITTGTTIDDNAIIFADDRGVGDDPLEPEMAVPFAGTRGFTVLTPTSVTFNLVCEETNGDVRINHSQMTALFVPTVY